MKLITFFLLFSITTHAQLLTTPDKKSETIIIVLQKTPEEAYRHVASVFHDEGWQLERTDPVLMTIVTDWRRLKGFFVREWQVEISIRALGKDTHVYLRGKARTTSTGAGSYIVDQIDREYNFGKDWKNLETLADKIGDSFLYK